MNLFLSVLVICSVFRTPMVVVHAETKWHGAELIAANVKNMSVDKEVYILTSNGAEDWRSVSVVPSLSPKQVVSAPAGYHNLKLEGTIIITGGYFRACYANAVHSIVCGAKNPVTIIIPMKAVYQGSTRTLYDYYLDNYVGEPDRFRDYISKVVRLQFGIPEFDLSITEDTITIKEKPRAVEKHKTAPMEPVSQQRG